MLERYCNFTYYNNTSNDNIDNKYLSHEPNIQVCLDEVGRGSWAGRVYTAAVIWNPYFEHPLLNEIKDSKKLTKHKREYLYDFIIENCIDYSCTFMEPYEIDEMNILQATMKSMKNCLDNMNVDFDSIVVDGNYFCGYRDKPYKCIIKGDNTYIGIACASIIAKVEHDRHMTILSQEYPQYDWNNNMGYGSYKHKNALEMYGITKHHRVSFSPISQLTKNKCHKK